MPFGAHEHRVLESISVSLCSCDTKTHQRTSTPQSRKPCRQTHGFLSLNRVQGGSACAGCKGKPLARSPEAERSGPRHFAGFRRKTESVIVGSYTFAESAVPPSPRAPNKTHHTHERKEVLGNDVWHYHLHVVYVPVVEKQILWSKRCKDPALVGTVKETIMQVSHSKKWQSQPVLDEFGEPLRTKTGKIVLKKSYSVLQDQYYDAMFAAGYTDVKRGERGSTEEHLTTVQFKVMKEQEALDTIIAQQQNAEQAVRLAQASREEAEHEAEVAQKKLISISNNSRDIETFVQRIGSADELLPDTGMLETARSYRENKVLPVIKKLVRKLREVYALLVNERQKNYDMLRETAYWKRKAENSEVLQEKAFRLDRLTRTLGSDEIDRLLSQRSAHERSWRKSWDNER